MFKYLKLFIAPNWTKNFRLLSLAILSVACGVALIVSVLNSNDSILEQFNHSNTLINGRITAQLVGEGKSLIDEATLGDNFKRELQNFDFSPCLEITLYEPITKESIKVYGLDLLNGYRFRYFKLNKITDKAYSALLNRKESGIIFTESSGKALLKQSNNPELIYGTKKLLIKVDPNFTLDESGIAQNPGEKVALADIRYLQEILETQNKYSSLDFIDVKKEQLLDKLKIPDGLTLLEPDSNKKEIEELTEAFRFNLQALSYIALMVASYLIFQTMFILFQRRIKEIGIMRTLGMTKQQIFSLIIFESFLIGLLGSALGAFIGVVLSGSILEILQKTYNELYFSVQSSELLFSSKGIIAGIFIGTLTSIASGIPSAYKALKVEPILALRSQSFRAIDDSSIKQINYLMYSGLLILVITFSVQSYLFQIPSRYIGFLIAFIVLFGLSLTAGLLLRLIQKYLETQKNWFGHLTSVMLSVNFLRLWISIGALICGLSMTIGIYIMVDSFRFTVQDWINDTLKADIYVSPPFKNSSGLNEKALNLIANLDGVKDLDYLSKHQAKVLGKPAIVGGSHNLKVQTLNYKWLSKIRDFRAKFLSDENYVIVSNTFASKRRLKAGDPITLKTSQGEKSFTIAGVYQDYSSEHGYVLMQRDNYLKFFNNPNVSNLAIYAKDNHEVAEVKKNLSAKAIEQQLEFKIQLNGELRKTILEIFDQTFKVSFLFFWIALLISILTVALTMIANIQENSYLIETLKYLGASKKQIIFIEVALGASITLIASLLSLVGGFWLANILESTVNHYSFGWIIYLHPNWFNISFIAALAFLGSLVGSLIPFLRLTKGGRNTFILDESI